MSLPLLVTLLYIYKNFIIHKLKNSEEPTGITLPVIAPETPEPLIIHVIAEHGFTMRISKNDNQLVNYGK